jgi:hypothetical protein
VSVASIGSGGGDSTALAAQLAADQKALLDAQSKKAAQAVLTADEAKIQADQLAIATAASKSKAATASGDAGLNLTDGHVDVSV